MLVLCSPFVEIVIDTFCRQVSQKKQNEADGAETRAGPGRSGGSAVLLQLSDHVVAVSAESFSMTPSDRKGDLEAFITLVLSDL